MFIDKPKIMKRGRIQEEDDPEVVPLSKRINNIHVNGRDQQSHTPLFGTIYPNLSLPAPQITNGGHNGHNSYTPAPDYPANYSKVLNGFLHAENSNPSSSSVPNNGNIDVRAIMKPEGHNPRDIKYQPILGPENNPHYYDQNRILFELYKERLERNNLLPHPNYEQG